MISTEPFDNTKTYPRHDKCHPTGYSLNLFRLNEYLGGVLLKDEEGSNVNTRDIILGIAKAAGAKV